MATHRGRGSDKATMASFSSPWHAVGVVAAAGACQAVRGLADKRFLPTDAPRIPLYDCSSPLTCGCVYRHFPDRRGNARRVMDRGAYRIHRGEERRQATRGRRAED